MGRPKKSEEDILRNVTSKVDLQTGLFIEKLAKDKQRSKSWVIHKLLLLGIVAFQADGDLEILPMDLGMSMLKTIEDGDILPPEVSEEENIDIRAKFM